MIDGIIEDQLSHGYEVSDSERSNIEKAISEQGARWMLLNGVWAVFLEAAVAASVALLISTFASSTLFTIVCGLVIYLIGHLQAIAREYLFQEMDSPGLIARGLAAIVSLMFPDFHQFSVVAEGMADGTPPAASLMWSLTGIAFFYPVIYNLVAYLMFSNKEL